MSPFHEKDQQMEDRKKRKAYWDHKYRDYWMQRVSESNTSQAKISNLNQKDVLTSSDQTYFEAINLLDIAAGSTVLEMGCGFGRSIPFLQSLAGNLHAIDISEAMVQTARETNKGYSNVKFYISEAEKTPFENNIFDYVVSFAVFDAVYQDEALQEINRITRQGGCVLLTGKNNNYFDDDEEAFIAEIRAREKKHPNYFTDVSTLLKKIDQFGFKVKYSRFFLRRGDFNQGLFVSEMPQQFYEYLLILEKVAPFQGPADFIISDSYSLVWKKKAMVG